MFSHRGFVDELDDSRFVATVADKDIAWQRQYGGTRETRLEGAKRAIIAVLSDICAATSSLLDAEIVSLNVSADSEDESSKEFIDIVFEVSPEVNETF